MKSLQIAVLFSGSASALRYLYENDPNYGHTYEIICGICNKKDTKGEKFCREKNINFVYANTKLFCKINGYEGKLCDMPKKVRTEYYKQLLRQIDIYKPDMLLLSGFMLEIIDPLLSYVPIINVHPADLEIKDIQTGKPKYTGDDAVTMAFEAGELYTASTIHVVEQEVDCGKIICVSDPLYRVDGVAAKDHQEKMKILCDGPAYQKALEMITSGSFSF